MWNRCSRATWVQGRRRGPSSEGQVKLVHPLLQAALRMRRREARLRQAQRHVPRKGGMFPRAGTDARKFWCAEPTPESAGLESDG